VTLATAFFSSGTWLVIRNLLLFFAAVIWFASLYWIYKDAKRRIHPRLFRCLESSVLSLVRAARIGARAGSGMLFG